MWTEAHSGLGPETRAPVIVWGLESGEAYCGLLALDMRGRIHAPAYNEAAASSPQYVADLPEAAAS